nr:hypothetical protein CFP56_72399 [Quercus suber]
MVGPTDLNGFFDDSFEGKEGISPMEAGRYLTELGKTDAGHMDGDAMFDISMLRTNPDQVDQAGHVAYPQDCGPARQASDHATIDNLVGNIDGREAFWETPQRNPTPVRNNRYGSQSCQIDPSLTNDHTSQSEQKRDEMDDLRFAVEPFQGSASNYNHQNYAQGQTLPLATFDPLIHSPNVVDSMANASINTWNGSFDSPRIGRPPQSSSLLPPVVTDSPLHSYLSGGTQLYGNGLSHNSTYSGPQGMTAPGIFTNPYYHDSLHQQAMHPHWSNDQLMVTGDLNYNDPASRRHAFPEQYSKYKIPSTASPAPNLHSYHQQSASVNTNAERDYQRLSEDYTLRQQNPVNHHHSEQGINFQQPRDQRLLYRPGPNGPMYTNPSETIDLDLNDFNDYMGTQALTVDQYPLATMEEAQEAETNEADDQEDQAADSSANVPGKPVKAEPIFFDRYGRRTCPDCGDLKPLKLKVKVDEKQDRCKRHWDAYVKGLLGPPMYTMDPAISDGAAARNEIFPSAPGLVIEEDDWRDQEEDVWVERFIQAINCPYSEDDVPARSSDHAWLEDQQNEFNRKPGQQTSTERGSYNNRAITARVRLLYMCAMNYHRGGQIPYPVGGDNWGYEEDQATICSQRLEAIERFLKVDKRICMNVIEGRGVYAFAKNPMQYALRKATNSRSNSRKKALISKGKIKTPDSEEQKNAASSATVEEASTTRRPRKRVRVGEGEASSSMVKAVYGRGDE